MSIEGVVLPYALHSTHDPKWKGCCDLPMAILAACELHDYVSVNGLRSVTDYWIWLHFCGVRLPLAAGRTKGCLQRSSIWT